jgi:hypothetical protein
LGKLQAKDSFEEGLKFFPGLEEAGGAGEGGGGSGGDAGDHLQGAFGDRFLFGFFGVLSGVGDRFGLGEGFGFVVVAEAGVGGDGGLEFGEDGFEVGPIVGWVGEFVDAIHHLTTNFTEVDGASGDIH